MLNLLLLLRSLLYFATIAWASSVVPLSVVASLCLPAALPAAKARQLNANTAAGQASTQMAEPFVNVCRALALHFSFLSVEN